MTIALAAGGLAGGLSYLVAIAGQAYGLPIAAAVSIFVAIVTLYIIRRIGRAKSDIVSLLNTLNNIGGGTFDEVAEPPALPGADDIKSAVNSISREIQRKVDSLHKVAHHDALTGLCNRAHFQRTVEPLLLDRNTDYPHCILFIDLDGFKQVNDTLGHGYGDRLLQMAADRLRIATHIDEIVETPLSGTSHKPAIYISRFGGDEFVVFLAHGASGTIARKLASRILRVLSEPFELGAHSASVSGSIGVAFFPESGENYSMLLRAADTAMYHSKRSGRNQCTFYASSMDDEARRAAEEEQELREAIIHDQFELYFQPLFDIRTMRITSAEALIRWRHPRRGLLLPAEFLPLAERADLMCQIGEWVIGEATKRIGELSRSTNPLKISINISPYHLEQIEFVSLVRSSLQRWRAPAQLLELEITEEVAIRDPDLASERLGRLSELGISIALDDFGTGYSNLASLITLPLSRLKIDRSLLKDLVQRTEARVLVQTIISMANGLGFHSVAEGVETRAQLDLLSAMGCDVVQGYLLARPVPLSQLKALLAEEVPSILVGHEFTIAA